MCEALTGVIKYSGASNVCVRACVRACVRVCVRACVLVATSGLFLPVTAGLMTTEVDVPLNAMSEFC